MVKTLAMRIVMARATGVVPIATRVGVRLLLVLAVALSLVEPREAGAQAAPSAEYQVKAALLLNFAQFIKWPAAAFPTPDAPITVGILGDDPFGDVLDQTFQDETVQGRKLVIKRSRQVEDLKSCHLLFISKSEKDRLAEILASLNDTSIVTVGETDQFTRAAASSVLYVENEDPLRDRRRRRSA